MTDEITNNYEEQEIISVRIEGKKALYASYMAFLKNGGLFLPNHLDHKLGEIVTYHLDYVSDDGRENSLNVTGKVVWKTPHGAQGGRIPGIGIEFTQAEGKDELYMKRQIETCLGNQLTCGDYTYTV